jgi:hypothetical protein
MTTLVSSLSEKIINHFACSISALLSSMYMTRFNVSIGSCDFDADG